MQPLAHIPPSITGQIWCWRGGTDDSGESTPPSDDLITQLLLARGCTRDDLALHRAPTLRHFMPDPSLFQDMDRAASRIADAIQSQERLTVYGDYDVDGATSAALVIRLMRDLGLEAGYYIPDRLMEGYGPSGAALVKLAEAGSSLVITVDCGAQAFEALEMAQAAKLDVIVVDHHKCASALPPAYALINPNRLDERPEAAAHGHLAAVGVAFLLGVALLRELRRRGYFEARKEPDLLGLLDLVALGTVADVAQLKGLNRAFVSQGLKVMGQRRNLGLATLANVSRLKRAPLCHDLGFALGPRINAGGRVGKSDLGVRLLTSLEDEEAHAIALELDRFNEERRAIEATVQEQAEGIAAHQANRSVLVVSGDGWHPGVIGIIAGRLKEKFSRPVIVVATDEAGIGKGSGRSISGVDLGAAVLAAKDSGLLVAGGGHAMAAGLTVERAKIDALHDYLDDRLAEATAKAQADRALAIDSLLAPRALNPDLVNAMEAAGPYGMGWPAPRVVIGPVRILKADVVGSGGHVRLLLSGHDGASVKAVAFRQRDTLLGQSLLGAGKGRSLWFAGRAKIDEWGGGRSAELHIEDAAWAD